MAMATWPWLANSAAPSALTSNASPLIGPSRAVLTGYWGTAQAGQHLWAEQQLWAGQQGRDPSPRPNPGRPGTDAIFIWAYVQGNGGGLIRHTLFYHPQLTKQPGRPPAPGPLVPNECLLDVHKFWLFPRVPVPVTERAALAGAACPPCPCPPGRSCGHPAPSAARTAPGPSLLRACCPAPASSLPREPRARQCRGMRGPAERTRLPGAQHRMSTLSVEPPREHGNAVAENGRNELSSTSST